MDIADLCVSPSTIIRDVIKQIDTTRRGIALVTHPDGRLVGTITDGDLRRAVLAGIDLSDPASVLLARKAGSKYSKPIAVKQGASKAQVLALLRKHSISHVPVVDAADRVVDLVTRGEFLPEATPTVEAVIMAGGYGRRLQPLSDVVPKPMLPIGERPLMEIIVEQLREAGIKRVNVTTHYQSWKIMDHFGDGSDFGVSLSYVTEDRPLGTAGGLGLLSPPSDTLLVMNADILTDVDFRAMVAFHREQKADFTLAVREHTIDVPYGVVQCEGPVVRRLTEKPALTFLVNAGIYLLEPSVYSFIPNGEPFDMTELIGRLLESGRAVVGFPIHEYWRDIGHPDDYQRAQQDAAGWGQGS